MKPHRLALLSALAILLVACVQQPPAPPMFPQGFGGPTSEPPPATTPLSPQGYSYQRSAAPAPRGQTALPPAPKYPSPPPAPAAPAYPAQPAPQSQLPAPSKGWRHVAPVQSEPLVAGGASRHALRVSDGRATVDLQVVTFSTRRYALHVIDQRDANAGGRVIAPLMRAHRAVAGVNGGFFTPAFEPLGKMIAGGHQTGALSQSKLLSGLVISASGKSWLMWRDEFRGDSGISDLLQAGPRLVSEHSPVGGLDRQASRARTFITTDGSDGWSIGIARNASLGDAAEILSTPGLIPGHRVWRALNLDGGNSSAIWMQTRNREISDPGWSTVRNYLAIVPR